MYRLLFFGFAKCNEGYEGSFVFRKIQYSSSQGDSQASPRREETTKQTYMSHYPPPVLAPSPEFNNSARTRQVQTGLGTVWRQCLRGTGQRI